MENPNYPATSLNQGVNLTIDNGNLLHNVINGADDETFEVDDGVIPSLRKSIKDAFYYKDPLDWNESGVITEYNQLVKFTDGTMWEAPTARVSNPIIMGVTPYGDALFKVSFLNKVFISYNVANVPTPTGEGHTIYVVDGDSGNPCLATWNGYYWARVSLGLAISET